MKRISIKVIPNAKKQRIVEDNGALKVYVNAPAIEGKANKAVIELLVERYNVRKRDVRIISGETSRKKLVEIDI